MALQSVKLVLLFLIGILADVALGALGNSCSVTDGPDAETALTCSIGSLQNCEGIELNGDVYVIGNGASTWDVEASPLSFASDARVTVSCLRIALEQSTSEVMQLLPVNYTTLLSPPFVQPASKRPLLALTLRDVEISVSCEAMLEWQHYLCGVQLPGKTVVHSNTISIISWTWLGVVLERVNLTCDPGTNYFAPVCSMAVVDQVSDILDASSRLQDPYLPLVLTVSRDLTFTDSLWPESGLRITANVTLSATLGSNVTISFGLKTVLFTVDKNSSRTAFLSFRGCILLDLPLSYLPLNHPRRPFGVLSTGLWPVYRDEVAMGLYDCTLILTHEEFKFWSFWLSILLSPIPHVSATGNWTYANDVKLGESSDDYIQLLRYMGRYTTLMNVRYQVSNDVHATQQRNNILQITNDESVPPTVVFQTRGSDDLLSALLSSPSATAAQHGQYILLTCNVVVDDSEWPAAGAPVRYPTTITTWPSSWVALDLKLIRNAFLIQPSTLSSVAIKNVLLLNLATGGSDDFCDGLTSGLWAFNFTNWRNTEQQRISLDRIVMVVSRDEVAYYIDTTVKEKQTDTWISSFKVESYDEVNRSWVYFATLATARFSAQSLNITDTIPDTFDSDSFNITTLSGFSRSARLDTATHATADNKREVLLFALLVITLPTALGTALLTFLVMKRRRLSQICRTTAAPHVKQTQDAGGGGGGGGEVEQSDVEGSETKISHAEEPPACCFPLSLSLRKSKFINPMYDDAGRAAQDIVLTAVLGPAALARSLVSLTPETLTVLDTDVSVSTATGAGFRVGDVTCAGAETGIEQDAASAGTRSMGACSSRALGVLSAAPAELRQSGGSISCLAAVESGVSSLSESCAAGFQHQPEDRGRGSSSRSPTQAGAAVAQSAAGTLYGRGDGAGARASFSQVALSQAALVPALTTPSSATEQAARTGRGDDVEGGAQRLPLNSRPDFSREILAGAPRNPRFLDVQQLDRLRHDIGDRHLEVQHSLGWGGCGVVYKGIWKGLQVAVKTILLQGDSKQSQQFLMEAAISASLQHSNIVTTYLYELRPLDEVDPGTGNMEIRVSSTSSDGASHEDGERMSCWRLYIVQEYCELGTLKAAIDQGYFKGPAGGPPSLAFVITVALDIALGLAHVHSKNVVHGDVTVSNVLLQACPSKPQGCIAKVADFGLSVKFEAGQTQGYHLYGGTPHYMAPERARGVLSKRSDIYSLGVCLWELYCGTPPWRRNAAGAHHRGYGGGTTSSSVDSCQHHHTFGDSASVFCASESFRFPRGCPSEYSTLVHSCVSTDPQARPTTAAVASTLQRLHRRYC